LMFTSDPSPSDRFDRRKSLVDIKSAVWILGVNHLVR
jgi:hypothetical protein